MNHPRSKPPTFRSPSAMGKGRKTLPPLRPRSVVGMSLGTRIGLGIAIGLFASIAVVLVGAVAVKVINRPSRVVAEGGDAVVPRSSEPEVGATDYTPPNEPSRRSEESLSAEVPNRGDQPSQQNEAPNEGQSQEENESPETNRSQQPDEPKPEEPTTPDDDSPSVGTEPTAAANVANWLGVLDGKTLTLPKLKAFGRADGQVTKLFEIPFDVEPTTATLKLLGSEVVFGDADAVTLKKLEDGRELPEVLSCDEKPVQAQWTIQAKAGGGIGGSSELGRFAIQDNWLTFKWDRSGGKSKAASLLKYCLLEVSMDAGASLGKRAVCRLGTPAVAKPVPINLLLPNAKAELPFRKNDLPPLDELRMKVVFEYFPRLDEADDDEIQVDEALVTKFFLEKQEDEEQPAMEIEARFEFKERPTVIFEVSIHPDRLVADPEDSETVIFGQPESRKIRNERKDRPKLLRQRRKDLRVQKAKLEQRLLMLASEMRRANFQNRRLLVTELTLRRNQLADTRVQLEENEEELEQVEVEEKWRDQVTELLTSLKTNGRVGLQLSIEIDGKRIVIAAPKSE